MKYRVTNSGHRKECITTLSEEEYLFDVEQARDEHAFDRTEKELSLIRRANRIDKKLCGCSTCMCRGFYRWEKI